MELGSEFDLDLSRLTDTTDTVFEYLKEFHTIYTDSGRSALRLLSGLLSGEAILVPDYICGSVAEALPGNCRMIYYPLDREFHMDMEKLEALICKDDVHFLYLMHYFGSLQQRECIEQLAALKKKYHLTVIEDTTHSLFTAKMTVGDYGIASLRKWFPLPDGGVLYTAEEQLLPKRPGEKKAASRKMEAMILKKMYLTEQFDCNTKYRELFVKEEEAFDHQTDIYEMSDIAYFLLSHYPVAPMCRRRKKNTAQLSEALHRLGYDIAISMQPSDVLLALPIYAVDRNYIRERLMEHNIFCAVHWPLKHSVVYEDTRWIGDHILSLPMDQRYQEEEIEYLLGCLEAYW